MNTPNEIENFIKKLKNKTYTCEDNIPNIVLKNLPKKAVMFLTSIYNAFLRNSYFPSACKNAIIIEVHKPSKPKDLPASYRPISLLCTMSKLYEKITLARIQKFIWNHTTKSVWVQANHSTTHQLQRISEIVTNDFEKKFHCGSISGCTGSI